MNDTPGRKLAEHACRSCGSRSLTLHGVLRPLPPGAQAPEALPRVPPPPDGTTWIPWMDCGTCGRTGEVRIERAGTGAYEMTVVSWELPGPVPDQVPSA